MKYKIKRNLHTDFSVFEENKLPARSYFIPFPNETALDGSDYKNERYTSDRIVLLSGEWDFVYYGKLSEVPEPFDSEKVSFDRIVTPSTWQRTGYDRIAYINTRYPFPKKPPKIPADVATGIYRKTVNLQKSARQVITFLGVAGALALYINGAYVGYSEGSHNAAEFDITGFTAEGENEIVAVVYKWSNGTYLECQDMFRENGIFRDAYITLQSESRINDFLFRPKKNPDGTYDLTVTLDGDFSQNACAEVICDDLFSMKFDKAGQQNTDALSVKEWTAETPDVYEVKILLKENGEAVEAIRIFIGFRDITIDGEVFLFNGKPVKMLGVNHHDTHMTKGYAMSLDDLETDIKLMKQYNCNAVRTSHYPPDPVFLTMCDLYGLYAVDEADIETHGFYAVPHSTYNPNRLSNDIKWASHYLDRVKRMYERDKNHPCITMWSLGNESGGYKCQDVCYDFLKKVNPEVPVHYEGAIRSKRWAYDVVSRMYGTQDLMRQILAGTAGSKYKGKPFFQCEYAHAMGNGPGGLEEYIQLFYSSDQFMGGCIWEWADHSVYDENAKYKWTYGGDHNEPIHDGNFCVDGLFYPDRRPSSGALEMKVCYRPVRAIYVEKNVFRLTNKRQFTDTSDIRITYDIVTDGAVAESGEIRTVIEPLSETETEIKSPLFNQTERDVFVNFRYENTITGEEIAVEQVIVSQRSVERITKISDCAEISERGDCITVTIENGKAVFDKKKGLVSLSKYGNEYLNQKPLDKMTGFVPHIYRGRLDNDQYMMIYWLILGLAEAKPVLRSCKTVTVDGTKKIRTSFDFVTRGIFVLAHSNVDYTFGKDGEIQITASLKKICPLTAQLPRFGVHVEMPKSFERVSYYGRGSVENYSDFKEHAPIGFYETVVSKMGHKYIKPQDSGNRGDVRYAEISGETGKIRFSALGKLFSFNANHFTLGQLKKAKHIEDLPDTDTTFAAVDGFVRGTGSGSCGPIPSKEHLIKFGYTKPLKYSFKIKL